MIFTSNVEEPDWADYLGDPITTKAILDRIFHHSVVVRISGPSYREYQGILYGNHIYILHALNVNLRYLLIHQI
ncbi:MAG: ATP-binding protein [Bacteroidales bacterium]|nr:ATP-binding protein [Bacteroidales bacterium]